ncbi:MAG: hypothetical protein A3K19_26235 [Lentisphaerae bacterium RIFOXYB12_FULL_65_16]|nr:MAG: hypothetical protein A3K18_29700 [Lentisphaerae bacterium RIFOXYA12_64_32]OGV87774.1 MAG: hypothetical protein A3K19_26235 [Lentisphaerae bacterium RIFOXYB12_FULL_65_16]
MVNKRRRAPAAPSTHPAGAASRDSNRLPHVKPLRFKLSDAAPLAVQLHTHAERVATPVMDMHYEVELGVVLSGSMTRLQHRKRFDYAAGDVWFHGFWEPHGYILRQVPCEVLVVVVWPPALASQQFPEAPHLQWLAPFTEYSGRKPQLTEAERKHAVAFAHRMKELAGAGGDSLTMLRRRLALTEFLLPFAARNRPAAHDTAEAEEYRRISPALQLAFRVERRVSNEEAAAACGLSHDTFMRAFRSLMGATFADFARRHRAAAAARDLAATDMPVKAVAARWGFTDESHLHRVFREHYGCNPGEYRHRMQ